VAGVTGGTLSPVTVLVLPEQEAFPLRHGLATLAAFVMAGSVPLVPYVFSHAAADRFVLSTVLTLGVLFTIGAARARVGSDADGSRGTRDDRCGLGEAVL